jgi:hypothetical protein
MHAEGHPVCSPLLLPQEADAMNHQPQVPWCDLAVKAEAARHEAEQLFEELVRTDAALGKTMRHSRALHEVGRKPAPSRASADEPAGR